MDRAASLLVLPDAASAATLDLGHARHRQTVILALAVAQGRRAETAVVLAGIDPREAAGRILRGLTAADADHSRAAAPVSGVGAASQRSR